jgi:hypothetical protein
MSLRGQKNFSEELVDNAQTRILERLAELPKVIEAKIVFRDFFNVLCRRTLTS